MSAERVIVGFQAPTVPSLGAAGKRGRVVVLSSDNKFYGDNGSAWVGLEGGGGGAHQFAHIELTDAQIKALPIGLFEIVPAPGADKFLEFRYANILVDATNGEYTNIAAEAQCWFTDDGSSDLSYRLELGNIANIIGVAGKRKGKFVSLPLTSVQTGNLSTWANKPICFAVTNFDETFEDQGAFEDGHANNKMIIEVVYRVVEL